MERRSTIYKDGIPIGTNQQSDERTSGEVCEYWIDITWTEVCVPGDGGDWEEDECEVKDLEIRTTGICNESGGGGGTPGAGGGPPPPSGGGTGGTGGGLSDDDGVIGVIETLGIDDEELEAVAGDRPIKEYNNKCTGILNMWNLYPNNEVSGYLTKDGKIIVTGSTGSSGGGVNGVYEYDGVTYYTYPKTQGAPNLNYAGMINDHPSYYFIPVVASIHTHTPCRTDGTNGVSHAVGSDDSLLAARYPQINHWVIGCNAIAQFEANNPNFFNVGTGALNTLCNNIQ